MVSLKALKRRGITEDSLKAKFTAKEPSDAIKTLKDTFVARINDAIQSNFLTYKLYWAIDQAYGAPLRGTTATLIRALATESPDSETLVQLANAFALEHLLYEEIDPKTEKPTGKKRIRNPIFTNVSVPLVPSYVKKRAARITNARNLTPHLKYEPLIDTPTNRGRCDILTGRIETMDSQMGYRDVERQCILKSLMYGWQLQFIQEDWYKEEQEDDDGKVFIDKEGVRYHLPHPTRTYYDAAHPLATLHSDTGCSFLGYWRVLRYGALVSNKRLWNVDSMKLPSLDYRKTNGAFFSTVYPCRIQFPRACPQWGRIQEGMDRETALEDARVYTSDWEDAGVVFTNHYERLIPSECGLGDYDYPVWFAFVIANADTVLHCVPLPDTPAIYWPYDPDESRTLNPSLALEVLPFQEEVSNLLNQLLFSVYQNLNNLVLMDENVFDEEEIRRIERGSDDEQMVKGIKIKRVDGKYLSKLRGNMRSGSGQMPRVEDLVTTVRFPQLDTNGCLMGISTVLNLMERVLGMSAQEVAAQATHEQSRAEIVAIGSSTTSSLAYTAASYDRARDSWKRQLFSYLMAYGEDDIYAYITPRPELTPELLKKIDVTIEEDTEPHTEHKLKVKAKKSTLLQLEYFASTKDGTERTNHPEIAQAMMQFLSAVLANPMMASALGPSQAVLLINKALDQFGFPQDFKLRAIPQAPMQEQQQWVMEQLKALSEQIQKFVSDGLSQSQQQVMQQVTQLLSQALQPVQQAVAQTAQEIQKVEQVIPSLQQASQAALVEGKRNEAAIAKVAEVLDHQQELHDMAHEDINTQNAQNANQTVSNPIDALRNQPTQDLAVVGGS